MSQELENEIVGIIENKTGSEETFIPAKIGFSSNVNDVACRQTDFFNIIESVISKEILENTKQEILNCIYQVEKHFKKYNLYLSSSNIPDYESWFQEDMINYIADHCNKITNKNILDYDAEEDMINFINRDWFLHFKNFVKNILQRFNRRLEILKEEQDKIIREQIRKVKHNELYSCECGATYTKSNKLRHLTSEIHNNWKLTNNNITTKSYSDIILCECGGTYTRSNFYHHKNTSQHCYFIENNIQKPTTETCQCGIEYEIQNKSHHLISNEHFENLNLAYDENEIKREKKRLEYNTRSKEQISCECGGKYTKCHFSTHCQSKKHVKYMISITSK